MKKEKFRVLLVGPHLSCKGGITTVFKNYINYKNDFVIFKLHSVRLDGSKILKLIYIFPSIFLFIIRIIFCKYDIIHIHPSENYGYYRYIPFLLISKLFNKKILLHMHACKFDKFYHSLTSLKKKTVRVTMNMADAIICLSDTWKNIYEKITENKIYIIHNTVKSPNSNFYSIKSKAITFLGFIGDRKGLFDLFEALSIIKKTEDFKIEIGGAGDLERMYMLINKYQLDDFVEFHGWVDQKEKHEILKRTAIFVLPSYNEGLPMVLLEAMSYGIPIISTTVGGIPELVNINNGYLVKPGDINGLKSSIEELLKNKKHRKKLSKNNFDKIQNQFSMRVTFEKLKKIYQYLCEEKTK